MKKIVRFILHKVKNIIIYFNHNKYNNKVTYYNGSFPVYNKVIMNNEDIIQNITYKDKRWNHIKYIAHIMWNDMFKFRLFQYHEPIIDNMCDERYIRKEKGYIKCEIPSKNENEWIFLHIPNELTTYEFSFDATLETANSEFQIAFNIENIGKRYRFNLVNNEIINFDIVNDGVFYNKLISVPFVLNLGQTYNFKLKVNENKFQYLIDNRIVMSVLIKTKKLLKGDIALILWNSGVNPINVEYKNLQLRSNV